jgi:predicted nucleic acid-binding protein
VTERFFLDTNVLVYTFDSTAPRKQKIAKALVARALESREGVISYQVTQEFLNVAIRKFSQPMSLLEAQSYLRRVLAPLCEIFPDASLYENALSVAAKTGWAFYDSLILASAAAGKCGTLFSEDLQSGRVIQNVEIQNPFS